MKREGCHVIVNADDFGQSPGVNRGIIRAFEQGIVTSTSMMVRWPAATEAAAYARANRSLGVGLHLDLCEWRFRNGDWDPIYQVVPLHDCTAVAAEVTHQLERFQELMGKQPTHLDSHQHMHLRDTVSGPVDQLATALGVPVRSRAGGVRYCGDFYGQLAHGEPFPEGITVERLCGILDSVSEGFTEIGCHPAFAGDLDTMYAVERETELAVLCHPTVRAKAQEVSLCSFARIRGARQ